MISKNQIKLITSLQLKKYRIEHQLFIAEGVKVIQELLQSNFELEHLYVTNTVFEEVNSTQKTTLTEQDMNKITALNSPSSCLAIFIIPKTTQIVTTGLIVALDDIRDPGNLGTIIRLCDWFGVKQLLCSAETVDVYSPKVIQSTMGSISRVNVNYVNLDTYISQSLLPVYGTFMNGDNIYKTNLPKEAILILGNEANGISEGLKNHIKNKIAIPRFGDVQQTESLNVATATAIFLSEFRRSINEK